MDEDIVLKLETFFSRYKSYRYKKRENILFGQQEPSGVYYVAKGSVRTISLTRDGRELTVTLVGSHDIFPILWTLYGSIQKHTFQAFTDTEIKRAPKEDYLMLIKENPDILAYTIKKVLSRLTNATDRLETTLLGNAYQKVISVLIFIANNIGTSQHGNTIIDISLTHQEIAAMAGLTRETVTIEMDKLQKEGLIQKFNKGFALSEKLFNSLT